MADSAALLRMLEPTVRPVPTAPQQGRAGSSASFETRGFDELLHAARHAPAASQPSSGTEQAGGAEAGREAQSTMLGPLTGIDRIENDSLRRMISDGRPTSATGRTDS